MVHPNTQIDIARITQALNAHDMDAALAAGLLEAAHLPQATLQLKAAARQVQLAHARRARFIARNARIARRAAALDARRAQHEVISNPATAHALPSPAAAALARALARAKR